MSCGVSASQTTDQLLTLAAQKGLRFERHFSTEGVHPYDEVEWEWRDARITNYADGSVAFEQKEVEFPAFWSQNATAIFAKPRGNWMHVLLSKNADA